MNDPGEETVDVEVILDTWGEYPGGEVVVIVEDKFESED